MSDLVFALSRAAVMGGKIVDEDGKPMSNVMVGALRQVYRDGRWIPRTWRVPYSLFAWKGVYQDAWEDADC
jgi:hypothetical protein